MALLLNPALYNGKEYAFDSLDLDNDDTMDVVLGWYDYGARFYDPAIGRFIGVDPISDQFPHVSTFNYAENEPIANIDLHGLQGIRFDLVSQDPGLRMAKKTKSERQKFHKENKPLRIVGAGLMVGATAGIAAGIAGAKATAAFVVNEIRDEVLSQATGGASDVLDITKAGIKAVKEIAGSIDDIAKNLKSGSDKLSNVEVLRDNDFMQVTGEFDGVEVGMQGTFSVEDGVMTIYGVDFSGEVGVGNIRKLIREFGSTAGVNKVTIIPNKRTTGANPGKTPEPFTIDIND